MKMNTKIPRALTTFKLEGKVISLSESPQGEVEDNREVWRLLTEVNCPKYNKERKKRKILRKNFNINMIKRFGNICCNTSKKKIHVLTI